MRAPSIVSDALPSIVTAFALLSVFLMCSVRLRLPRLHLQFSAPLCRLLLQPGILRLELLDHVSVAARCRPGVAPRTLSGSVRAHRRYFYGSTTIVDSG